MAETKKGKKIVYVHPYVRADGTKVPAHERSTPDTSTGPAKPASPGRRRRKAPK
jgi:hypothetical protein